MKRWGARGYGKFDIGSSLKEEQITVSTSVNVRKEIMKTSTFTRKIG
jgi:hypothetical protein